MYTTLREVLAQIKEEYGTHAMRADLAHQAITGREVPNVIIYPGTPLQTELPNDFLQLLSELGQG